jgi:hypothetical protein
MTTLAARLQAIKALLAKIEGLNVKKLVADVDAAIQHPSFSGAIEALEEGADDGAILAGIIPGGQGVAVGLGVAATALGLLDEAIKVAPLATDFGARLAAIHIHVPALFAVHHGPVEPIFGGESGPERVFGFTPDP